MFDITEPRFSATDLVNVAGIDRKLVNLWLERELIQPSHIERLAVRKRPSFSVVGIFKAKLTKTLADSLEITTSYSTLAAIDAERAAKPNSSAASGVASLANVLADDGWMWAVARSVDRDKPLAILAAISRKGDRWQFFLGLDVSDFTHRFGPDVPYAIIPIGAIFASVYEECKKMRDDSAGENA